MPPTDNLPVVPAEFPTLTSPAFQLNFKSDAPYSNFFGKGAGYGATSATQSNIFGVFAGVNATNAFKSNFFGGNAGGGATGASFSNFFGYNVGESAQHAITGSNNILIGTNITTPAAASANTFNIGNVLYGANTYATTTGAPSKTAQTTGQVGINVTTPAASAALDVTSVTAGFLPPRMTTAQRDAIASAATGLQVYNTSTNATETYNGTAWGGIGLWTKNGNDIYNSNSGKVGIGTSTPSNLFSISGDITAQGNELTYPFSAGSSSNINKRMVLGYDATNDEGVINSVHTGVAWKPISINTQGASDLKLSWNAGLVRVGNSAGTTGKLSVGGIIEIMGGSSLMLRPSANDYDMRLKADGSSTTSYLSIYSGGDLVNPRMTVKAAGDVNIGTATTVASSLFTVVSTAKGSIPAPVMTTAQRDLISLPATGLQVYNTTTNTKDTYNGTNWVGGLTVSSAATLTLIHGQDYVFTGTTSTWTLPAVSASILGRQNSIKIKNRGSGTITLNSNAGNTIYSTAAVGTINILAGTAMELMPDGTYFLTMQ